jgi:hypothetical protein
MSYWRYTVKMLNSGRPTTSIATLACSVASQNKTGSWEVSDPHISLSLPSKLLIFQRSFAPSSRTHLCTNGVQPQRVSSLTRGWRRAVRATSGSVHSPVSLSIDVPIRPATSAAAHEHQPGQRLALYQQRTAVRSAGRVSACSGGVLAQLVHGHLWVRQQFARRCLVLPSSAH